MTIQGTHPKEYLGCPECSTLRSDPNWEPKRRLPQVGQTYECGDCGHEVYVYDASEPPNRGQNKQWRPVGKGMLINLQFWSVCEAWPDGETEDLLKQGLDRMEAIDYHIVEREAVSQVEWAEMTDRAQPTVSENVAKARDKLDD